MVILCRVFPDAQPAEAACEGIKSLTTILQHTNTGQTRVNVANYIAALCHTRPGKCRNLLNGQTGKKGNVCPLCLLEHPSYGGGTERNVS